MLVLLHDDDNCTCTHVRAKSRMVVQTINNRSLQLVNLSLLSMYT